MTPYMDKQIMDLSQQQQNKDFIDLQNHSLDDEHGPIDSINKEEIVPSYDFQPIRPFTAPSTSPSPNLDGAQAVSRVWNSSDSSMANTATAPVKSYSSLDSTEPSKFIPEKDRFSLDVNIISEIDKAMKKHVDNLLHVLQNFSAQLTQMESRTRYLESSMDELKVSIGNNHGNTDGKLRQLENILTEVQSGVQVLKDKQEIVEAHLQFEKLKVDQQPKSHNSPHVESIQPATPAQPSYLHLHPPSNPSQSIPSLQSSDAVPQLPTQQNLPASAQLPNHPFPPNPIPPTPQSLREPYFPPPAPTQETLNPQYQQRHSSPAVPLHQQYQPSSQQQYSQLSGHQHQQQQHSPSPLNPSQPHPPLGPQAEETPYIPSQNYPPNLRQNPPQPPTARPPLTQQFYGGPSVPYEPPSGRTNTGFSSGYGQPAGPPSESFHYGRSPPPYSSSPPALKPQLSSSTNVGRGGYPQLPTARVLPHALPTASGVSGGSGPAGTGSGNRVPADEIVEKVASMGFSRDLAMSTIRKLTENGQSVDLNLVLDKLMNEGEVQPGRSWAFGR